MTCLHCQLHARWLESTLYQLWPIYTKTGRDSRLPTSINCLRGKKCCEGACIVSGKCSKGNLFHSVAVLWLWSKKQLSAYEVHVVCNPRTWLSYQTQKTHPLSTCSKYRSTISSRSAGPQHTLAASGLIAESTLQFVQQLLQAQRFLISN